MTASPPTRFERKYVARALRFDDLTTTLVAVAVLVASFPHAALAALKTMERIAPWAIAAMALGIYLGWRGPWSPPSRAALRAIRRSGRPQLVLAAAVAVGLFLIGRWEDASAWWWIAAVVAFAASVWWLHHERTQGALALLSDP
ncbi:MAG: hypothetical protein ACK5MP_07200 [Nostocoides sp.]